MKELKHQEFKHEKLIVFAMTITLTGCGAKGLDQLAACGECVQGLQELGDMQSLMPLIDKLSTETE